LKAAIQGNPSSTQDNEGYMDNDEYANPDTDDSKHEPTVEELDDQIRRLEELKRKKGHNAQPNPGPSMSATYAEAARNPATPQPGPSRSPQTIKAYFTSTHAAAQYQESQAHPESMQMDDLSAELHATTNLLNELDSGISQNTDYSQPGPSNQHGYLDVVEVSLTPEQAEFNEVLNRTAKKHATDSKLRKGKKK
jgi:hypothetical protein